MTLKAVLLIGGPIKGTRFRPLSLEMPKPLFPLANQAMIQHHVNACLLVPELAEIILVGFFEESVIRPLLNLIRKDTAAKQVSISYLREHQALGTGGGLYHFRDQILRGKPEAFFVLHADVSCTFPLQALLKSHRSKPETHAPLLGTHVTQERSHNFGCIVEDPATHTVLHYAEKPETFVSTLVSAGVFLFAPAIFDDIVDAATHKKTDSSEFDKEDQDEVCSEAIASTDFIRLEKEVFVPLAGTGKLAVYTADGFWSSIKNPTSTLSCNAFYLDQLRHSSPDALATGPHITGNVIIDPSAEIDPSCKLGPNVSIGAGVRVCGGVRIANCIVLEDAVLDAHCCLLNAVIGWRSTVGKWARVEGLPMSEVDKSSQSMGQGKKLAGATILGSDVTVSPEVIIRNCVVLPHKGLTSSHANEILL